MNTARGSFKVARAVSQLVKLGRRSNSTSVLPNFTVQSMSFVSNVGGFFRSLFNRSPSVTAPSMVLTESEIREHYVKRRIIGKIELFGLQFLTDTRTRMLIHDRFCINYVDNSFLRRPWYWRILLKLSKSEKNIELKQKLQNAGLTQREFCYAIPRFYATLDYQLLWIPKKVPFEKDVIVEIVNEYQRRVNDFNPREVECIRVLLSMKSALDLSF